MRTLTVAVAGLGTVGREVCRLLKERRGALSRRLGAELTLVAVADRSAAAEARGLGLPATVARYRDPLLMAREGRADLFVELLGGLDAPRAFAKTVLGRGRALVTANKRLLAEAWPEIIGLASATGARLAFEGSVAGGIPVLRALELSLAGDRVLGVDGILNGTTNYILTRCEEGASPAEALAEAQRLGFAEKDPSFDLSGRDAAQKLCVLAGQVTGGWLKMKDVAREGIEKIEARDTAFARERLGRAVRLVGSLRFGWDGAAPRVEAGVFPTLVPLSHPLASVRRQYNALLVHTASAADLMFYGQGAGAGPTASAVLADIFVLARDLRGGLPPALPAVRPIRPAPAGESVSGFYLRLEAADRPGVLARATQALAAETVSIASIHQERSKGRAVPVMITTHPAPAGKFERARRRLLALPGIGRRHAVMRLLA
jgi:homoserine dehydrogenase